MFPGKQPGIVRLLLSSTLATSSEPTSPSLQCRVALTMWRLTSTLMFVYQISGSARDSHDHTSRALTCLSLYCTVLHLVVCNLCHFIAHIADAGQ
uniref:Putative secreted protein n=1 Tax=Anopheles darlingi TaxID=43151 RepID=A0A2M4D9Q8_ANODA